MFFHRHKNHYSESVKILAEQGYSDEYVNALKTEINTAKKADDRAEGANHLASAYLFRGELTESAAVFAGADNKKLPKPIRQAFFANYYLCLFLMNKFREADEIYVEYNKDILGEANAFLRRSVGIHEFIAGHYDAAATVFIKLLNDIKDDSRATLMVDICIVRTFLKLDMYDQAYEMSADFARYDNKYELTKLTDKLKKRIFDSVNGAKKADMVKRKKKK